MFAKFFRNQNVRRAAIAVALFVSLYFVLGELFGPRMFARLMNGVAIAIGTSVLIVYSSVIVRALRAEKPDRVQLLSLGIGATWLGFVTFRVWYSVQLSRTSVETHFDSDWVTVFLALFIVGGIQHIAASGRLSSSLPTIKSRVLVGALVIGALVFGFVMGAQS